MRSVCHITTGLNIGGTELFLLQLVKCLDKDGYRQVVISLLSNGDLINQFERTGIKIIPLGISKYPWSWVRIFKLFILLKKLSPDLVQTWLYHADLLGGCVARLCRLPVIWNIRQSNIDSSHNKRSIIILAWVAAKLSWYLPAKIVCCAEAARHNHIRIGYDGRIMTVIPNGCDISVFRHHQVRCTPVRETLNIGERDIVIGRFGRFDKQKDYRNFIQSAIKIQKQKLQDEKVWFLLVGAGIDANNTMIKSWISGSPNPEKFIMLGNRCDLPDLYQVLDIMVSSSAGEGFPNVIAEAMACEIPCIVTDVGESGNLVADTGKIVPKENSDALATACVEMISMGSNKRRQLGMSARRRVSSQYSMQKCVDSYKELYARNY